LAKTNPTQSSIEFAAHIEISANESTAEGNRTISWIRRMIIGRLVIGRFR